MTVNWLIVIVFYNIFFYLDIKNIFFYLNLKNIENNEIFEFFIIFCNLLKEIIIYFKPIFILIAVFIVCKLIRPMRFNRMHILIE